jgi:hypothetical protein
VPHDGSRLVDEAVAAGDATCHEVEVAVLRDRVVEAAHFLVNLPSHEEIRGLRSRLLHLPLVILERVDVEERPDSAALRRDEADASRSQVRFADCGDSSFEPRGLGNAVGVAESQNRRSGTTCRAIARRVGVLRWTGDHANAVVVATHLGRAIRRAVIADHDFEPPAGERLALKRFE